MKYGLEKEEMLVFGKYDPSEVEIGDPALQNYISLEPKCVPHCRGMHANTPFGKERISIVERLINKVMRKEHNTGKKIQAYNIVKESFAIIEKKTDTNPLQILVNALINAGPREGIVRLKYGGIAVPKSIDISSMRRLNVALQNICEGARRTSFKSKKSVSACLADEIMNAANNDSRSFGVSRKEEIERVAKSAR